VVKKGYGLWVTCWMMLLLLLLKKNKMLVK